jgi:cell division protein FtsZ
MEKKKQKQKRGAASRKKRKNPLAGAPGIIKCRTWEDKSMRLEFESKPEVKAKLKVVGVGGAGGNAVNRMIESGFTGVEFVSINTDMQALEQSIAPRRIQIGAELTHGLGSGGDPEVGRQAIEENRDLVLDSLKGADMIFIAGGMGGGTGTGAGPVIADLAKQTGALVVGVVTKPFQFEGARRSKQAEEGLVKLKEAADTAIVIPNQRLLAVAGKETPIREAFRIADEVLLRATKGVSDLITVPGLVNLDFADVKSIMAETGDALMGTGSSTGENRAVEAAQQALSSPLLEEARIAGAKGVLVNVSGSSNLTLHEINEAAMLINEAIGAETNMMFGAVIDESLQDSVAITVIATGIGASREGAAPWKDKTLDEPVVVTHSDQTRPAPEPRDHVRPTPTEPLEKERTILRRHKQRDQVGMYASGRRSRKSSKGDLAIPTFMRKQMD